MNPYRFGPAGRELFGVYFPPAGAALHRTAVLLCAPFGPEATRSHRIYRVFAERLAKAGFATLRFDYFGTGDSDGAFEQGSLAGWCDDIASAHAELIARSGSRAAAIVGLRLGASLAMVAAARCEPRPARVVAWDPIVDGAAYLAELAAAHRAFLQRDFGLGWLAVRARVAAAEPILDEALGFPLTPALRAELAAFDLAAAPAPPLDTRVVATASPPAYARLRAAMPALAWRAVATTAPWNSDEAMNSSIVPADLIDAVQRELEDVA